MEQTTEINGTLLLKQLYDLRIDGVPAEISAKNGMFEGDREHYLAVGQSALRCIKLAMLAAARDQFRSILDFGCGFGRVLRVLRSSMFLRRFMRSWNPASSAPSRPLARMSRNSFGSRVC